MCITIRRAGTDDDVLLSVMGAETFSDTFGPQNSPEDMLLYLRASFSPEIQAREIADPSTVFLIAEVSGEPVGYARLREGTPPASLETGRPVEIVRLYARSPWIGRRVGAALMQAALEESHARGCDVIWLDVWDRNRRAIEFYRRWGFMEFGTQPFRLGNDLQNDLLMARPVSIAAPPH